MSLYPQTSTLDSELLNLALHIPWIKTLISTVAKETRLYLFNANEPFNFDFLLMVIQKDVSHDD